MSDLILRREQFLQTKELFLDTYSVIKVVRSCGKLTDAVSVINSKDLFPTLASIKKKFSDEFVLTYIELWIQDLNDFLNVKRKMTAGQRGQTAVFIYDEFYYFNLAEFNLVFSRIKKGDYGSLFESIDGSKIISCFREYDKERTDAIEEKRKAESEKKTTIADSIHEKVVEKIGELVGKLENEKIQNISKAHDEFKEIRKKKRIALRRRRQVMILHTIRKAKK